MIVRGLALALAAWTAMAQSDNIDPISNAVGDNYAEFGINGFADPEACYDALEVADADDDRRISPDEYALFVQDLGPDNFLSNVGNFAELPLVVQSNFNILACLCQDDPDDDTCCLGNNAGLETAGAFGGEDPSPQQQSYLFLVCSLTSVAIDRVLESVAPTPSPVTPGPTPTTPGPPSEKVVFARYSIGVTDGANTGPEEYIEQLEGSMNALSPDILLQVRRQLRRQLRSRRRLKSVQFSTSIEGFEPRDCPPGRPSEDRCERVEHSITLLFQPEDADPEIVAEEFSEELGIAIDDGQLQDALSLLYQDSKVYIIDGHSGGDPIVSQAPEDDGVSAGAVAGGVIGALVGIGLLVGLLVSRRSEPKEDLEELVPAPKEELELECELSKDEDDKPQTPAILGATTPDYGKLKDAMVDNDDDMSGAAAMSHDSSSNAGSSGWSSSAGVSSLNTGSADGLSTDHDHAVAGIGTTLASMSSQSRVLQGTTDPSIPNVPAVSRSDLDNAIEAGDWAAVGATAALLAAASDSQSYSSKSEQPSGTQSRTGSSVSSMDAARAAELDNLVDAGDWEGVVLAAAKYEAAEGPGSNTSGSGSRSNTEQQTMDSGSMASSPSKAQKRQELREVVEDLVRRVVPEEIQNVDEMMMQFRGREEELVETLRTMQERAVAQKARNGAQKAAKVQAKTKTTEARAADASAILSNIASPSTEGSPAGSKDDSSKGSGSFLAATSTMSLGSGIITSQPAAKSLGTGTVEGLAKSKSLGTGTIEADKPSSQRDKKQSALEMAIEAGDWEAVGEAAAMLSDHSMASSADTDEINRLADGLSSQGSGSVGSRGDTSAKAEELDELIDRGDWAGVAQAAGVKGDDPKLTKKQETEKERATRRLKHLKEEEEALAQADIWMAIAEQSKQESEKTDKGASEAADWAIGRSLQALVEAEAGSELQSDISEAPSDLKDEDQEEV